MRLRTVIFVLYFGTNLGVAHFLIGWGIMGGEWEDALVPPPDPSPDDLAAIEEGKRTLARLPSPLGVGVGAAIVEWPTCVGLWIKMRPGGRPW